LTGTSGFAQPTAGSRRGVTAELIRFPLRVGVQASRLALRSVVAAGEIAIGLLDRVASQEGAAAGPAAHTGEGTVFSGPVPAPAHEGPVPAAEPADADPPVPPHVSEEPELVSESADPGAVNGAGAELTVDEPWPGYGEARAADVIAALADATREQLALVELYEAGHRSRKSVLAAVERELKIKTPPGSQGSSS
jgi:hypothetical protein